MFSNVARLIRDLVPSAPLMIGTVVAIAPGSVTVELPGGGILSVRGSSTVGARVFVRDGVIEGPAPSLPIDEVEL